MIDWENLTYEEARTLKESLEELLDSPGWAIVREFIAARTQMRLNELVGYTIETQEQVARYNRLQGQMEELARLPEIIAQYCSDLAVEVKRLQDEVQAELELGLDRRI